MLTMIKTLLKTKDIFIHEKTNSIVMRDTPEAIRLAEKMVADQDIAEPEVMLEVEVLEVSTLAPERTGHQVAEPVSRLSTPTSRRHRLGQTALRISMVSDDLLASPH